MPIFGHTQPPTACQGCCGLNLLTAESQRTEPEAGEGGKRAQRDLLPSEWTHKEHQGILPSYAVHTELGPLGTQPSLWALEETI